MNPPSEEQIAALRRWKRVQHQRFETSTSGDFEAYHRLRPVVDAAELGMSRTGAWEYLAVLAELRVELGTDFANIKSPDIWWFETPEVPVESPSGAEEGQGV